MGNVNQNRTGETPQQTRNTLIRHHNRPCALWIYNPVSCPSQSPVFDSISIGVDTRSAPSTSMLQFKNQKMKHFAVFVVFVVTVALCSDTALAGTLRKTRDQCTNPHESWLVCGPSCDTECATLNEPCLVAYFRCPDGCYCSAGFARNNNGECVLKKQCPPKSPRTTPIFIV